MEKIKSLTSSAPGKLKGVFKRDKGDNLHAVLQKSNKRRGGGGDPFIDGPTLEEPTISKTEVWVHLTTLFFTFLSICTVGATAGFQARWFAVSGGTGFTVFLTLLNFFLTTFLVAVPLIYDRWDKLKRPAKFLQQARVVLILTVFGALMGLVAAMIVTISAFTAPGCKSPSDDPHAALGDDFKSGLGQWCTTKRACAVFLWLALGGWLILTTLAGLAFRRERKHEPSFIPPSSPTLSQQYAFVPGSSDDEPKLETSTDVSLAPARRAQEERDVGLYNDPRHVREARENASRTRLEGRLEPGQNAGDAFPLGTPAGQPSRTLQLAYSDPYAHIRESLVQSAAASQPVAQTSYFTPQPAPPQAYALHHHQQPPPHLQQYSSLLPVQQAYNPPYAQSYQSRIPAPPNYEGYHP